MPSVAPTRVAHSRQHEEPQEHHDEHRRRPCERTHAHDTPQHHARHRADSRHRQHPASHALLDNPAIPAIAVSPERNTP